MNALLSVRYKVRAKNNDKTFYERVRDLMQGRKEQFDTEKRIDFGSGRIETGRHPAE